ncbi:hypothetical protein V8V91_17030 [Algoriphagus halophilus]|uniref:hypothetical protein n=1 Tax=Algoriphagus halophilus TaxID=226505 RepID=UPI00358E8140
MSNQHLIFDLETLKKAFENSNIDAHGKNRKLAKSLKEILLKIGMNSDATALDMFHSNFYSNPDETQRLYGNWSDKWQSARDGLSTLCTKAITKLNRTESLKDNKIADLERKLENCRDNPRVVEKTITKYPPTQWKLIRNIGFWGVWISATALLCWMALEIGKAQEKGEKGKAESRLESKSRELDAFKIEAASIIETKSDSLKILQQKVITAESKLDSCIYEKGN